MLMQGEKGTLVLGLKKALEKPLYKLHMAIPAVMENVLRFKTSH